ncbi:mechanosensitive ion channel family protein [Chitinophaga lutea]|nr:mechanosensitive ion channel domain-containing protein [Chitinophaga lutea]
MRLLVLAACFWAGTVSAQQHMDTTSITADTAALPPANDVVSRVKQAVQGGAARNLQEYREGRIRIRQGELIEQMKRTLEQAKIYLKKSAGNAGLAAEIEETAASLAIVKDGVFTNKGSNQTQRNLTVSAAILAELYQSALHRQQALNRYTSDLIGFKDRIDSLSVDSALYFFPGDSAALVKYVQKLAVVVREVRPIDSSLKLATANAQNLQLRLDPLVFEIRSALEDIEIYRQDLSGKTFRREFSNIWGPVAFSRPLEEIMRFSWAKEALLLRFYVTDNGGRFLVLLLVIVASCIFLRSLKRQLAAGGLLTGDHKEQLVVRYPLLSAALISISIFQFMFQSPPFIINYVLWVVSAVCLAFIFSRFITGFWMSFWIVMITLFVLAGADNFILQASRTERYFMLALQLAGILYTGYILSSKHRHDLREKNILYFIAFVCAMESVALAFNVYGRHNLSKTFMVSGYAGVLIAILFLWTVRLINEGLGLAAMIYKHPDRRLFYLNFSRVGQKVPALFYVLLVVGWFILVGRNFYGFKLLADPLNNFLSDQRTLGHYEFSINTILVFVLILVCAAFLSRLISFFAAEPAGHQEKAGKMGLGNWILLIRIFIFSLGLFLAFAATGIPLDRITIILGALGVGIGLGLQGLVNNLVSGLIIAFEKQVSVGDLIEINGKLATMKSIGFRSSVVTSIDGACIIIPNGQLLQQDLVNWTMGRNVRRVDIIVGVAYGTDLPRVIGLLRPLLEKDERILHFPVPSVLAKSFDDSSVNIELVFWVRHISEWRQVNSEMIQAIHALFKAEGVVIPFPQRDVHIQPPPGKE